MGRQLRPLCGSAFAARRTARADLQKRTFAGSLTASIAEASRQAWERADGGQGRRLARLFRLRHARATVGRRSGEGGLVKVAGAVALVTGANRGIGEGFVRVLLARGASKVYAAARDPKLLPDFADARVVPLRL